ncbi:7-cyano-7-deazaguanine synthase QueC [Paenibacillus alkalitolerans]|uniref:7-cyano-7-deazaguanine synthase QueC n=1 Tax=Paenibacillus alkalitolerans TaxID=2799335 RepID=UPI0018F5A838|nr:7-cyano-7-deazaguanine synthase QueC [Paenibacillus alkalitolerans]
MSGKKAVVILSGGLDSTTCMGFAKEAGYDIYPITFDYGQRHRIEINNARAVARFYGVSGQHKIIDLPFLREFGASALTDSAIDVPVLKNGSSLEGALPGGKDIPVTYVPGRNLLFLSIAASYAEASGAEALYIGVNALDYSGYPDCRPEFIEQFERTVELGTKAGVQGQRFRVETPLILLSKADIIREGTRLGVPYHLTTSCYNGKEFACGVCDSCVLRLKGFAEAGLKDPIPYV